jgi:RNA polymerase sigma factor (sigma-70 family)
MSQAWNNLFRCLYRAAGQPATEVVTDGELLERFATQQDQSALELLIRRHAGLVWSVCRRQLGETADAEDALQATFLVLVRKARKLERRPSLSSWLYGVAFRVVQKARSRSARRQLREGGGIELDDVPETSEVDPDLRAFLDAEIDRLPERYRAPLLLCYFQGKTNEEAARELGCSAGLVAKYLSRGRERLRERLQHSTLAITAGLLTASSAEASAPPALVHALVQAALPGGQSLASSGAQAMAEGVLHMMFVTKVKKMVGVAACAILLAGTGWLAVAAATANQEPAPSSAAKPVAAAPAEQRLTAEQAAQLKKMILPQPGENPFWQIAWHEDVWEARQQAAKEGKPLFVWGGSEGAPITNC